ncbi:MAG: FAD-dependent oxidoreductase [Gaiellaceae bacterium MAG52_C11]|nr:FAD-dependent oxidoreductase [Candidatus Gaiellasilicea maunaloa]
MRYDLVIVGMGSGGIVAAEFAAALGLRVAAVERDRIGGDCLWTGCVPSKALLAAAKVAQHMRTADRFGIAAVEPEIDLSRVWRRIGSVQEAIAATDDSPERFESLGVDLVRGEARLVGPNAVAVGDRLLETRFVLLCTGSKPAVPDLAGLPEAGFLTSESVFELEDPPRSVVVIGGGPIAVELAQGLNRLGVRVTLLQRGERLLPRDEPELTAIVTARLREEGVDVRFGVDTQSIEMAVGRKAVLGTANGRTERWEAEELLVATGRTPLVDGLGLEDAGVNVGPRGIVVDERLRTSVKSVYAAGDVAGRWLFTHSAGREAGAALRDMFFPGKAKEIGLVPWCTFTDPELAHVGPTVAEAIERHGGQNVEVSRADLSHSDRARADGTDEGRIVLVAARGKLVGAHILAPAAGELIHELALAIRQRLKLRDLAEMTHVYPTIATSVNVAGAEAAYAYAQRFGWLVRREKKAA